MQPLGLTIPDDFCSKIQPEQHCRVLCCYVASQEEFAKCPIPGSAQNRLELWGQCRCPCPWHWMSCKVPAAQTTLGSHEHEHRGCLWGFSLSGRLQRTSGSTAAAPVSDTPSPSVHQSPQFSPAGTEHTCATSPNTPAQRAAPTAIHRL